MEKKRASEIEKNNKDEGLTQSKEGTSKVQNEKGEGKMENQKNGNRQADDNKKEKTTKAQNKKKGDINSNEETNSDRIIPERQHKKEVTQDHHNYQRGVGNSASLQKELERRSIKARTKRCQRKKARLNEKNNTIEATQTTDSQSNQSASMIKGSSLHKLSNDIKNPANDPTWEDTSGENELTGNKNQQEVSTDQKEK
ncbi:uncharacterized protein [Nicotiana tomentosiformis]|uniref:uncharacterized protein n=1 Tax=Nicotiana tomentosiformis TaxID=4098 RepID=UPI00051C38E6|nr:uncharacterized protein LOC104112936 [Nicotiana tomentosiformis]